MNFQSDFIKMQKLVEDELKKYMDIRKIPQQRIFDAMSYSLLAGGKRLRPVIMLYAAKMCGGDIGSVLPFACAMEMIHTYSLIHDDLPCMDNDDLRRGKPTNHKMFDEETAVLAGDALLNMAFEITSSMANSDIPADRILRAISVISRSSGAFGMIGGQMIDIESENKKISIEELKHLHSLKTGAIIRASGVVGAILSGADEEAIKKVDEYCDNLGIAFQIQDDILDVEGSAEKLGKPIGSDIENDKNTYVSLSSIEEAKDMVVIYTNKAIEALECFGDKKEYLCQLALTLVGREI